MSNAGENAGNAIKRAFASVHGVGETIRGNVNQFADSITHTTRDDTNRNIAERGVHEVGTGHYHGTGAGVTPADTGAERVNRAAQGEGSHFAAGRHDGGKETTTTTGTTRFA